MLTYILYKNIQTGLIWHHGAMLYYAGEFEAAVTHLDKCVH